MATPFVPSIERSGEPVLALTLPLLPWNIRSSGIGGSAVSAAGVPESFVIRTDAVALVTLRVEEEELEDVLTELEAIRNSSAQFAFRFDQDLIATEHDVYLASPVWPEPLEPRRDEFPGVFLIDLELRTVDNTHFITTWVELEAGS